MNINLNEANRCLICKNARCQKSCPIDTPIPEIIKLYKDNKLQEAGKILFENNPLSAICAIVCPHEDQCKGNCIKGIKDTPVEFHNIEHEISTKYLENLKLQKIESNNVKVAVVGSGPAGITIAFKLASLGYDVTIFEKNEKIGGILTYGIPEFRLPRKNIELLQKHLLDLGVKIKINSLVGPIVTLDKLFEDGFKGIFIGTGVWNPRKLNIPGETFGHVHYAINYLRSPKSYNLGYRVLVIGAGNVAMDAARSAKFNGSKEVFVAYRRDFEDMTATKAEINDAKNEGIIFETFKTPKEIVDNGVILIDTKKVQNEDNTVSVVNIEGTEKFYEFDSILVAISQVPRNTIVLSNEGLDIKNNGLLVTNEVGETTKPGVFACGDVTHGAKTVIEAVVAAKQISVSMDDYLKKFIK